MDHSGDVLVAEIDPDDIDAALYAERAHEFDAVRQGESKSGGWSGFADMITGQDGPSPGPQVTFKRACTYTVRFGISPPTVGTGTGGDPYAGTVHCLAEIVSGVEGQWVTRTISVCLGAAITLAGDSVQVRFIDVSTLTDADDASGLPYRVTAQIVPGERADYLTPPTLFALTDVVNSLPSVQSGVVGLGVAGNARYPIPPNAGVISCEVVVTGADEVTVIAVGGTKDQKEWNPSVNTGFVILPPSATFIEIAPTSDEGTANITVTWGIEG